MKETDYKEILIERIRKRSSRLIVVGAGYVGLPTAALFAEAGFPALVLDINPEIIHKLNQGCINTNEPGLNDLVSRNVQNGRLKAHLNQQIDFNQAEIVIIAVQTPVDEKREPYLQHLQRALDPIGKSLEPGMLVVLISTVPPKTTVSEVKPKLESLSGLSADKDFFLAYVPERIAPGKALKEFVNGTRLVGGIGKNSVTVAAELFKMVCKEVIETDSTTAEIAKLAENTYRDVNIAFANELALICERTGADVNDVINLANTHPRVNVHTPGPGVGGPCLTKDPYLLVNSLDLPCDVIKAAREVNDHMSKHMISLIQQALRNAGKSIKYSKIAILGVAYKKDTDDSRYSPAKLIIRGLISLGAQVNVYDPRCNESFGAQRKTSLEEALDGADCLVTITNHTELLNLNLQKLKTLMNFKPTIVDGRRIIDPKVARKVGFSYYGLGLGAL
jgi:UDP-N-acetyl-D-mannosaminuronic acid dehydrogenase